MSVLGQDEWDDAVDCIARELWEVHRQSLPGKGEGMTPPWGDWESGQCARFYEGAQAILRAIAGGR